MRFNNLIIAYSFPHIALHANLISLKRETTNCRGFVNREGEGERERAREALCSLHTLRRTHTDTHEHAALLVQAATHTLTHPHTKDKVRPIRMRMRSYVCIYVYVSAYFGVRLHSTNVTVIYRYKAKIYEIRNWGRAVNRKRRRRHRSRRLSQLQVYRAYLVVGTIIKSHFDHKIVHCVYPLHVATLFFIILLWLEQLVYHTSSVPPVVSQPRLELRISCKK